MNQLVTGIIKIQRLWPSFQLHQMTAKTQPRTLRVAYRSSSRTGQFSWYKAHWSSMW